MTPTASASLSYGLSPVDQRVRARIAIQSTIARWPTPLRLYLWIHSIWVALYLLLGKGFAYAGWAPFYAGEMLLIASVVALFLTRSSRALVSSFIGKTIMLFLVWQAVCTIPYIATYGIESFRDGALWGYSFFAIVIAALVVRLPGFPELAIVQYRRFGSYYVILGPLFCFASLYVNDWLPKWPDTLVSIPSVKAGDYSVHLAGLASFVLLGFARNRLWWLPFILLASPLTFTGRSGLLSLLGAVFFSLAIQPRVKAIFPALAGTTLLLVGMSLFEVRIQIPGAVRELSLDQLGDNIQSLIQQSDSHNLEGTKRWRLAWWQSIVDYTVFGPFFWMGKGYGINLADSDGFQVGTQQDPLRSPHNSHLTFLARSGVPGFATWILVQGVWILSMLRAFLQARRLEEIYWAGVFAWVIAYWLSFTISATFDVFLEGPMAAIPFWTLFGFGWGIYIRFGQMVRQRQTRISALGQVSRNRSS